MISPKRMSSGKYIDLAKLTHDDVDIEDITKSLNYIYRFTGHWKDVPPLTVAQHTLLTMRLSKIFFPDERVVEFDCLLHDMPECYYGDIATPMKRILKKEYKEFTTHVDNVVYDVLWGLTEEFTPEVESKRKLCDLMALDIERRVMWKDQRGKELWPEEPKNSFKMSDKIAMFEDVASIKWVPLDDLYVEMIND